MKEAYLLVNTGKGNGCAWSVVRSLGSRPGVVALGLVAGAHDMVAVLNTEDADAILKANPTWMVSNQSPVCLVIRAGGKRQEVAGGLK